MTGTAAADELAREQQRHEERMCNVGSPRGAEGTVERVYRARSSIALKAKVIMLDTGAIRYVDLGEVYPR